MIKSLKEARITDGLPDIVANQDWVLALSGALGEIHEKVIEYADQSQIYTAIDTLSEELVDALAVQLSAPYYDQENMTLDVKRGIVKNTISWYMKAGTPAAVKEMIQVIFGEGDIVEWFNFTEGEQTPGYFDIITSAKLTPEIIDQFTRIIDRVKNVRSHIRRILIDRQILQPEYVATAAASSPHEKIVNSPQRESETGSIVGIGACVFSNPRLAISNSKRNIDADTNGQTHIGMMVRSSPHYVF